MQWLFHNYSFLPWIGAFRALWNWLDDPCTSFNIRDSVIQTEYEWDSFIRQHHPLDEFMEDESDNFTYIAVKFNNFCRYFTHHDLNPMAVEQWFLDEKKNLKIENHPAIKSLLHTNTAIFISYLLNVDADADPKANI